MVRGVVFFSSDLLVGGGGIFWFGRVGSESEEGGGWRVNDLDAISQAVTKSHSVADSRSRQQDEPHKQEPRIHSYCSHCAKFH